MAKAKADKASTKAAKKAAKRAKADADWASTGVMPLSPEQVAEHAEIWERWVLAEDDTWHQLDSVGWNPSPERGFTAMWRDLLLLDREHGDKLLDAVFNLSHLKSKHHDIPPSEDEPAHVLFLWGLHRRLLCGSAMLADERGERS